MNYFNSYLVLLFILFITHRSDQWHVIETAADDNISEVHSVFDLLNWSEQSYRMFESIGQTGNNVYICSSSMDEVNTASMQA